MKECLVFLIGADIIVGTVLQKLPDTIVIENPLKVISNSEDTQLILTLPTWLKATKNRAFIVNTGAVSMMMQPSDNMTSAYFEVLSNQTKDKKTESSEETPS